MAAGDLTTEFAQFARELERAAADIKREVGALIPAAAEAMAATVSARYPRGKTGNLKAGTRVRTHVGNDPLLPVRRVIGAKLAYIWQDGTVQRHDPTRGNANRGLSPAHDPKFFERTAVQIRTNMLTHAQAILDKPRSIG
jgi:hypothetical protein